MRRSGRWFGYGLAFLLLLLVVDLQPGRRGKEEAPAISSWRASGKLEAGFSRIGLDPPPDCPLGGFAARRGAIADTVLDSVGATAMVLRVDGRSIAIVAVDLVLIPEALRAGVAARVDCDALWICATHTHSGPGGYWDNALAEVFGLGRFDRVWAAQLEDRIVESVDGARQALGPARLRWGLREDHGLARPRSNTDRRESLPMVVVSVSAGGPGEQQPVLGGMIVHAAHPTILGRRSRALSAGWPGWTSRALSRGFGGEWLVLQGAGGDLGAMPRDEKASAEARTELYGRAVADAAMEVSLHTPLDPTLSVSTALRSPLRADAAGLVPAPFRVMASNALSVFTRDPVRVDLLRLGSLALVGVGAEPVRASGRALALGVGAQLPGATPVVVGLTNGYLSYVEEPDRIHAHRGESERVYFGAALHTALIALAVAAAQSSSQTQ